MKSKFCMLLVLIIIAVMLMTATTALATRYFSVEVTGHLEGSGIFHLHGKRLCFDGPDLILTIVHEGLRSLLEADDTREGNTFLSRTKDSEDYSFEWRMYKDDPDCVIHLKSIGTFGIVFENNDPTQPGYLPTVPFIVEFSGYFELVELVFSRKHKKTGKPIGPGEWKQVWTDTLTFTITLKEL